MNAINDVKYCITELFPFISVTINKHLKVETEIKYFVDIKTISVETMQKVSQ